MSHSFNYAGGLLAGRSGLPRRDLSRIGRMGIAPAGTRGVPPISRLESSGTGALKAGSTVMGAPAGYGRPTGGHSAGHQAIVVRARPLRRSRSGRPGDAAWRRTRAGSAPSMNFPLDSVLVKGAVRAGRRRGLTIVLSHELGTRSSPRPRPRSLPLRSSRADNRLDLRVD